MKNYFAPAGNVKDMVGFQTDDARTIQTSRSLLGMTRTDQLSFAVMSLTRLMNHKILPR